MQILPDGIGVGDVIGSALHGLKIGKGSFDAGKAVFADCLGLFLGRRSRERSKGGSRHWLPRGWRYESPGNSPDVRFAAVVGGNEQIPAPGLGEVETSRGLKRWPTLGARNACTDEDFLGGHQQFLHCGRRNGGSLSLPLFGWWKQRTDVSANKIKTCIVRVSGVVSSAKSLLYHLPPAPCQAAKL